MTASLSSNTTRVPFPLRGGKDGGTKSTFARMEFVEVTSHFGRASVVDGFLFFFPSKTSITWSHNDNDGNPSRRTPASNEITSASELECDTAPCFLQNHVIGTKVFGPTIAKNAPEVLLLSLRSPAKLASLNNAILQSSGWSPTKHTNEYVVVQFK